MRLVLFMLFMTIRQMDVKILQIYLFFSKVYYFNMKYYTTIIPRLYHDYITIISRLYGDYDHDNITYSFFSFNKADHRVAISDIAYQRISSSL